MAIGFSYGLLCDGLEKQANEQGFTLGEKAEQLEKQREAITGLMFSGILTNSMAEKCFQKLQNQVIEALKPIDLTAN